MWESLRDWAFKELREVTRAPVAMGLVLALGLFFGWVVASHFYAERIEVMKQQLAVTDGQSKQLGTGSPHLVIRFSDGRSVEGSTFPLQPEPNQPIVSVLD